MTQVDLQVPFTVVACDGCAGTRAAGERCPHCGSTTIFHDPEVDRRRRVVDRVRPLLLAPTGVRKPMVPSDVFGALATWSTPFLRTCARVMEGTEEEAAGRIGASVRDLHQIQDRVARTTRSPSETAVWGTIDGVLAALQVVHGEYFEALVTADPAACREHAANAQRSLDAAGQIAGALGAQMDLLATQESGFVHGLLVGALGGWFAGRHRL